LLSHGFNSLVAYFLIGLGDHVRKIWIEGDPIIPILNIPVSGWILLADVVVLTVLFAKGTLRALKA